ncbi:tellurium resistance protein [Acinetobacter sp. ANC 5579]|uniref:tellurium resistance protein n=1 Tax=Acinetobacter TaxID=469 RepID=UPI00099244EA|nr:MULTISPECIES: tellurium resistance protein [Acinetobacter]MCL6233592.1 tellurium resistance protein [Acinetobacter amyesii]MCL6236755.1 tellurium resistance protein [Acinetobacter amyesii]MCL6245899.1 tellurium resistance protein [Acinetobacter amyesii]OOV82018.1 tellurium resistance protein [Acinetobacter sp. ANC 5600]UUS64293.1 tellurium resistance protein [Acinetobacter sp. YH12068_T]
MSQIDVLVPLKDITVDRAEVLSIKRNDLVPLLTDQYRLNHYADQLIQAQSVLLDGVDPQLTKQLSQTIEQLIQALANSKKYLKTRKFNALQKWLGIDLEYGSGQVEYYKNLDQLLDRANHLSQKLQLEIQKSQARFNQLQGLREQMARYIVAAEEFLVEYPQFVKNQHPLDNFAERLSKKVNTLQTLQASNDIAITQMQLSQQLSFELLDRYKEAQQVLIPAWQYHVKQSRQSNSTSSLEKLDNSRENLIKTLKKSLENSSKS